MISREEGGWGYPEGDILPFRMTAKQRQIAIEKSNSPQKPEYDNVQLFRAKPLPKGPKAPPPVTPPEERTRTCHCCGSQVRLKRAKAARPKTPPQNRWWLYYGPGRMTGGFRTKEEAKNWYLNGGR